MSVFAIGVLLCLLYFGLFSSLAFKRRTDFSFLLIMLRLLYDWIFITLSYKFGSDLLNIPKAYSEVIIILVFLFFLVRITKKVPFLIERLDKLFALCIMIPFSFLLVVSVIQGQSPDLIIKGIRFFFFPIVLPYALYRFGFLNISFRYWYIFVLIVVGFALFQSATFNGDLTKLWFYDSYKSMGSENPVDLGYYNFLKGEKLRSTSLFVTPIELSVLCGLFSGLYFTKLLGRKTPMDLIFLMISLTGIFLSRTRMGWIAFSIISFLGIKARLSTGFKVKRSFVFLLPLAFFLITVIFLIFGGIEDPSALGRLLQYAELKENFMVWGGGMGDEMGIFSFDSFYLCSLRLMGVLSLVYFLFYFMILDHRIQVYNSNTPIEWDPYAIFIISSASALIYVFAFHHMAGSFTLSLVFFLLFSNIPRLYSKEVG